jgi:uncharacterized membrane protein YeaQ/YmgE (transglycosylase-associated protein family)
MTLLPGSTATMGHDVENIFAFLLIGLIAGWLAGKISKGKGFGLAGNLVLGVVGAFLGGFLFRVLHLSAYGHVGSLVMATVGALLILYLVRAVKA